MSCSTTSLNERMPANVVVNEMNALRNIFLKFKKGNIRRMRLTGWDGISKWKTEEERASITELDVSNDACWSTISEAIELIGILEP
ncbi:hypothetical protein CFP56_028913 [Quercus suber]|uniref:Uncharacterized protein n=1 Tax=Quercus suber TaxID=58331 RepID=A0AAW0JSN8_QUESU